MLKTIAVTDLYSKKGSRLLAASIAEYWLKRGHIVFVESFPIPDTNNLWGVRSNLVNGYPQRAAA